MTQSADHQGAAFTGRGSVPVTVLVKDAAADDRKQWQLAVEVPVNLAYNGHPHVVMMATPQDLEDFAWGFSLSEGVLASSALIAEIVVERVEGGIMINVLTVPRAEISKERQARSLEKPFPPPEALRDQLPAKIFDVLSIQGLGPKTVRLLWEQLSVSDLAGLKRC